MSNIFRDPTEGATARRADLLRRRRDELVTMPHAIRRVYVARRARIAASVTTALFGGAMLAVAATPSWAQFLARGLPGINPAVLCTLVIAMWIIGLFAYVAARAHDEHRFAVAMSRFVMPGKDLNEDIERLAHEHPDQVARDMAHRLEVRSATLPVLAAGVIVPVTALYIGSAIRAGGWPVIAEFEAGVALHANKLIVCAIASIVLAIAMTKRAARLPVVAPLMIGIAIAGGGFAALASIWAAPVALVIAYVAWIVRRLRIERDLLQADDPAAGSEVFTIRGFINEVRRHATAVAARLRTLRWRWIVAIGAVWALGLGAFMLRSSPPEANFVSHATAVQVAKPSIHKQVDTMATGSKTSVEQMGGGALRITIDLVDDKPITIPSLVNLQSVPVGWSMRVTMQLEAGYDLAATPFPGGELQPLSLSTPTTTSKVACGVETLPFGLQAQGAPGHYVVRVVPVLEPAGC